MDWSIWKPQNQVVFHKFCLMWTSICDIEEIIRGYVVVSPPIHYLSRYLDCTWIIVNIMPLSLMLMCLFEQVQGKCYYKWFFEFSLKNIERNFIKLQLRKNWEYIKQMSQSQYRTFSPENESRNSLSPHKLLAKQPNIQS